MSTIKSPLGKIQIYFPYVTRIRADFNRLILPDAAPTNRKILPLLSSCYRDANGYRFKMPFVLRQQENMRN